MMARVISSKVLFVRKEVLFPRLKQTRACAAREQHKKETTFQTRKPKYLKRANHPKGWDAKLRGLKP